MAVFQLKNRVESGQNLKMQQLSLNNKLQLASQQQWSLALLTTSVISFAEVLFISPECFLFSAALQDARVLRKSIIHKLLHAARFLLLGWLPQLVVEALNPPEPPHTHAIVSFSSRAGSRHMLHIDVGHVLMPARCLMPD